METQTTAAATPQANEAPAPVEATPEQVIKIVFDPQKTYPKDFRFRFRKDDMGNQRPAVEIQAPVPLLSAILNSGDEKQIELAQSAIEDVIAGFLRDMVNDDETLTQETLDLAKVSWDYISKLPKAERKGRGLPKETWEAFASDYISIMPGITGRSLEHVTNAATHLVRKFQTVKTVKPAIKKLMDYLDVWFTSTTNGEQFMDVYEFLHKKGEELLAADEAKLLENF